MRAATVFIMELLLAAGVSQAARILGIIPAASISHQLPFRLVALELARRGHQLTVITTDPIKKDIENYTEVDISFTYDYWKELDMISISEMSPTEIIPITNEVTKSTCEIQLESTQFTNFLKTMPVVDVIILERYFYQCYYGLVHKLGSPPLIGFVSLGAIDSVHESYGNPNNPAFSPDWMLGFSDHMSFWQRLYNTYVIALFRYAWYYEILPAQEELVRKYFGNDVPSVYETDRNFSLLLINNHFCVNYPRPMVPSMIELTGLHLEKQRQQLPKDIQRFLDGASDGVIYFSLGSNVKSSTLPEQKRRAFLDAFAQLPQRVLWKWEEDSLPGQPENVMISKWLPQQDVLAHPNIRLFITQGGLQSLNEAGYFAVPLIGIPFIGDQRHNVAKIVQAGIGVLLDYVDVTRDNVLNAVRIVLEDERYRENMKRFSAVFRDHQETSLERAVWWVEYVIRHNGAPHLRSAALDLHWWQLLLLDVAAFVVALGITVMYVIYKATSYLRRLIRRAMKHKTS